MKYFLINLMLLCSLSQAQNIVKIEYWIDHDPGFDSANVVNGITPFPDLANFTFAIPNTLSQGIHVVGVRSKDSNSKWSLTNLLPIYITDSLHDVITQVEYFWDSDPGFGNSLYDTLYSPPIADRANDTLLTFVPMIGLGNHILYARSQDSRGRWSHTNYAQVTINGIVSVNDLQHEAGVNIYPNPFSGVINVVPGVNEKTRVIIYDVNGRRMIDRIIQDRTELDMSACSPGAYSVFVWREKNQIYKTTLIKE